MIKFRSILFVGEVLTAVALYAVYVMKGLGPEFVAGWALVSLLIVAVVTDLRSKLILDVITLPAICFFLLLRMFVGEEPWWFHALGGFIGFAMLSVIALVSRGGVGGGDVKLYAALGVAPGPWLMLLSFFLASFFGAFLGITMLLAGKVKRRQPVPFAPFIFLGTMLAYLYGPILWMWYTQIW